MIGSEPFASELNKNKLLHYFKFEARNESKLTSLDFVVHKTLNTESP